MKIYLAMASPFHDKIKNLLAGYFSVTSKEQGYDFDKILYIYR